MTEASAALDLLPASKADLSAEPVAEVESLRVQFRRDGNQIFAVRGIDLTIQPGEVIGLVGESGSGKSVLGLSLLGLLPPQAEIEGSVRVDGTDMTRADARTQRAIRRRSLGAVFQDPMTSLNPTSRIGTQLLEVADSKAEALRLLEAVGIPRAQSRLRQYPHQLSGGLRQRVMLAMAVARRPKLVIADEPTTALDVSVQAQVLALFSDLRREFGCAFVLITHDLGVVAEVADRIGVMYAGRIIELGQARDVLAKPSHPYTASLLGSRFTLHSDRGRPLPAMVGEPPDARINLRTCAFSPRCAAADSACEEGIPEQDRALRHDGVAACIRQGAALSVLRDSFAEIKTHPWPATATPHGGARVTNLAVEFGNKGWFGRGHVYHALRGISLEVGAGEAVAIVGESGSGKSTLLRALAGLQKPNSGTVQLLGGPSPQMVFQDAGSSLTPWMTIGELLAERIPELTSQMRRARISESLQRVGLPPEAARLKPDQMSGGQRQRAGLARAIIDPPGLLLCDEPISALDASLATGALNLIGRLRRELGFAMVFVTHDLAAARLVADRILVMTGGEIVEEGAPDEICRRPGNPYTRMLLDAVPHLEVAAWL